MSTGRLTFKLPEEKADFARAMRAQELAMLLWDHDQYLRQRLKYEEMHPEAVKALQDARDHLHCEAEALWQIVEEE